MGIWRALRERERERERMGREERERMGREERERERVEATQPRDLFVISGSRISTWGKLNGQTLLMLL